MVAPNEAVIEKLAKLMNFAANTSGPEAENAAQRAAEMMAKYQIEEAEIAARAGRTEKPALEHGRIDADQDAPWSRGYNAWKGFLCVEIAKAFGGRCYRTAKDGLWIMPMVGPVGSIGPARFLYVTLSRELERRVRRFLKETGGRGPQGNAYLHGAVSRIAARLREGRETEMKLASTQALVVIDRATKAANEQVDEICKNGGKVRRGALSDAEAWKRGHEEAGDIDLESHKKSLGRGDD